MMLCLSTAILVALPQAVEAGAPVCETEFSERPLESVEAGGAAPVGFFQETTNDPRIVYLHVNDGTSKFPNDWCSGGQPFQCSYGDLLQCKAAIKMWMDKYFAPYNIEFTFDKPADPDYVVVLSGGGRTKWRGCSCLL